MTSSRFVEANHLRVALLDFASGYDVVAMPGGHFLHREHPERFCAELVARLRTFARIGRLPRSTSDS